MKSTLISVLLIIYLVGYGQKDSLDGIRLYSLFNNPTLTTGTISLTPQKDTVDVIVLVSDTSRTFGEQRLVYSIADEKVWSLENFPLYSIRCKAVRDRYAMIYYGNPNQITEYLLPKKYIIWQSVIINDKN